MGDDDLAGLACADGSSRRIDGLDDDVLGRDVHASRRTLVRDEPGITSAIAIGDAAAEHALDRLALIVIETLGRDEGNANAQIVHCHTLLVGMARDQGEGRRVSEQHPRPARANPRDEPVEVSGRHVERRQQLAAQHAVPPLPDPVLAAQLDRRAPDDHLGIADVDIPPAGRAPFGRHVVAAPILADVEHQGLAARASGVVALQRRRALGLQPVDVGADKRLGEQRHFREIGGSLHVRGRKAMRGERITVVGNLLARSLQERLQTGEPGLAQAIGGPPLALLERAQAPDTVVALGQFVQRKQHVRAKSGVSAAHHRLTPRPCTCDLLIAPSAPNRYPRIHAAGMTSHARVRAVRRPSLGRRAARAGSSKASTTGRASVSDIAGATASAAFCPAQRTECCQRSCRRSDCRGHRQDSEFDLLLTMLPLTKDVQRRSQFMVPSQCRWLPNFFHPRRDRRHRPPCVRLRSATNNLFPIFVRARKSMKDTILSSKVHVPIAFPSSGNYVDLGRRNSRQLFQNSLRRPQIRIETVGVFYPIQAIPAFREDS